MRPRLFARLLAASGVWLAWAIVSSPSAANELFAPPVFYPVGNLPFDVACGDLNGDGAPDLVVSSVQSADLSVRFNDGAGNFPSAVHLPVGDPVRSVAIGDLNADGHADLALGRQQSSPTLAILYGDGAGGFTEPIPVGTFSGMADGIEILRIDAGQEPDIVIGSPSSGATAVFLAGAASFTQQIFPTDTAPAYPSDLAAGDLDQDGDVDFAVSASLSSRPPTFLLNQGNGMLAPPEAFTPQIVALVSVAIGDVDRNGAQDLVLLEMNAGTVNVYRNAGPAVFGAPTLHPIGTSTQPGGKVALGDLDGDGWLDAAVAPVLGNPVVPVLLGDRQGGFGAATHYAAGQGPSAITLADVDLDTDLDLVVACKDENRVCVLINQSTTTTAVGAPGVERHGFWLGAARPNPMGGSTAISFGLARASQVELAVFDVLGRKVSVLVDGELDSGLHGVVWHGQTTTGKPAGPGVYFYRLSAGSFHAAGKLERLR
jgi:hypothetical protein